MHGAPNKHLEDGEDRGLVWVVRGSERAFDEAEPSARPWLEESVDWNAPARPDLTRDPNAPDEDGLLWV